MRQSVREEKKKIKNTGQKQDVIMIAANKRSQQCTRKIYIKKTLTKVYELTITNEHKKDKNK